MLVGGEQASDITVETNNHVMERDEQTMDTTTNNTPPTPLHQLKTPPIVDEAKEVIKEHGCEIVEYTDYCVVTFPDRSWYKQPIHKDEGTSTS
jgi:hypothetical protein